MSTASELAVDQANRIGILIVDDHRMFADSLARLLSDEPDLQVLAVASSGKQALELATELGPKVALVDYQMPDQDGVSIAAELKEQVPGIMVVMLTGMAEDRILLAAIGVGCSGFLTKDRAASEVAEAVRAAASRRTLISPALLARLLPKLHRNYRAVGSDITEREREILKLVATGATNQKIAGELSLSVNTIRNYVQAILTKLGAHSKLEAVSIAVREGIVDYPGAL